ncbi:MAG: GYF domain-containing protein [Verrucomicrobiota bacterium]|nr:GYF domain-containing protein [Verrucomicrobiota bacterium]
MTYFVAKDGQQQGPYTLEQINSLLQQGQLTPSDLVFTEGWNEWKKISELSSSPVAPPIPKKKMSPVAKGCLITGAVIVCLGLIGFIGCISCAGVIGTAANEGGDPTSEEQPIKKISLNEPFSTDENEFQLTITKLAFKETVGSGSAFSRPSTAYEGGIYVCVVWKCENISKTSKSSFSVPRPFLFDSNGNKYSRDTGASIDFASDENLDQKILSQLNPRIIQTDTVVFEVSRGILNSGGVYLEFDDAEGSRFPIKFDSISDDGAVEEEGDADPPPTEG